MGTRTGRYVAPLATALLLTLTACASPPATPSSTGTEPGPLLTSTASAATSARPSPASAATSARPSSASAAAEPATRTATASAVSTARTGAGALSTAATAPVTSGAGQAVSPLPACGAGTLRTAVRGTLTFAVSTRAGAPWVIGNPSQGQGFEAAVGAAVARQLGFAAGHVAWKAADPAQVQAAKVAGADVGLGEFRTPDQGGGAVDYSTGYFSISDSVVARAGTPAAKVAALPALAKLRLASVTDSSAAAASTVSSSRTSYPTTAAALAALRRGAVDVAVVPTPAAVTAGPDIAVIGQLSQPTEQPAQFGMVLPKRSPLTSCVSAAIDQLRVTGVLTALVQKWVPAANKPLE